MKLTEPYVGASDAAATSAAADPAAAACSTSAGGRADDGPAAKQAPRRPRKPLAPTGLVRLVLAAAAGLTFLLMHGLDPVDTARAHFAVTAEPFDGSLETGAAPSVDNHVSTAGHVIIQASANGLTSPGERLDGETAGCVLALLALTGFLALGKFFPVPVRSSPEDGVDQRYRDRSARSPPLPVFVKHCVFRL